MELASDILKFIQEKFPIDIQFEALRILRGMQKKGHNDRILRCALWSASGDVEKLKKLAELADSDWRDVIVAGEYDRNDNRLRDLSLPFTD